ncbi:hypothetical protein VIGAN_03167800, partial [Vigna angularis var. angularis]
DPITCALSKRGKHKKKNMFICKMKTSVTSSRIVPLSKSKMKVYLLESKSYHRANKLNELKASYTTTTWTTFFCENHMLVDQCCTSPSYKKESHNSCHCDREPHLHVHPLLPAFSPNKSP